MIDYLVCFSNVIRSSFDRDGREPILINFSVLANSIHLTDCLIIDFFGGNFGEYFGKGCFERTLAGKNQSKLQNKVAFESFMRN